MRAATNPSGSWRKPNTQLVLAGGSEASAAAAATCKMRLTGTTCGHTIGQTTVIAPCLQQSLRAPARPVPTCLYSSRKCHARSCAWSLTAATSSCTAGPKGRSAAAMAGSASGCCCCCATVAAAGSWDGAAVGGPQADWLGAGEGEREELAPSSLSAAPSAAGPAAGAAPPRPKLPLQSPAGPAGAAVAASGAATGIGSREGVGVSGAGTGGGSIEAAAAALDSASGASGCSTPADRLRPRAEQRPARAW